MRYSEATFEKDPKRTHFLFKNRPIHPRIMTNTFHHVTLINTTMQVMVFAKRYHTWDIFGVYLVCSHPKCFKKGPKMDQKWEKGPLKDSGSIKMTQVVSLFRPL